MWQEAGMGNSIGCLVKGSHLSFLCMLCPSAPDGAVDRYGLGAADRRVVLVVHTSPLAASICVCRNAAWVMLLIVPLELSPGTGRWICDGTTTNLVRSVYEKN